MRQERIAMEELLRIGFKPAGRWVPGDAGIALSLDAFSDSANVLYAFVVDDKVRYIGKSVRPLKQRLYGYQQPGATQITNIKNNRNIAREMAEGRVVSVYVFEDPGLLNWGSYHVNLAAGLEDDLIKKLNPDWSGKEDTRRPTESVVFPPKESPAPEPKLEPANPPGEKPLTSFRIFLRPTYYTTGFFNVPVEVAHYFAGDGKEITIELGSGGQELSGTINRSANLSDAPRVMGGVKLRNWLQATFQTDDQAAIEVINPTRIRINKP